MISTELELTSFSSNRVRCSNVVLKIVGIILIVGVLLTRGPDVRCYIVDGNEDAEQKTDVYMNQFAVKVNGGRRAADRIAEEHGFVILGQIGTLENYYLLEHHSVSKRSLDHSPHHHSLLEKDPEVDWVQQQVELKRRKRDLFSEFRGFPGMSPGFASPSFMRNQFSSPMTSSGNFPDPMFADQWYLNGGAIGGFDMNVQGAWRKGITGKGVVVSILDDGIQVNHPDLIQNYDPLASADINGNDDYPMPQDNGDNKHGTRCAGEVAATAYNGICGVGIAYNASIGGVRMLDGTVNDAVEARALSHNPDHIDIYSASWGPEDDGKTVDGPGPLARKAFLDGVTKGRRGKGSIFIWASGNGGRHEDNCNCDGYTNSIYTLSISSATQHGLKPWYLEECSSTLATTYSSGTPGQDQSIITVDMDMTFSSPLMCTKEHTGTSASAPIAAGICALALEANLHLTWRDMQYLVVLTSNPEPMAKESGWITNGVRRKVSHKFGYGMMDAAAIVNLAERWRSVPPQHICEMPPDTTERLIPNEFGTSVEFYLDTDGCYGTRRAVNYLEHVQAKISLNYNPRGNLKIILQSPYGTSSTLLFPRPRDMYKSSFDDWPFLSVHFWGERPAGRWRLTIINEGTKPVLHPGILKRWSLVFYGTDINPIQRTMMPMGSLDFMPFAASSLSYSAVLPAETSNKSSRSEDDGVNVQSFIVEKTCHSECLGGCLAPGPDNCVACKHLSVGDDTKKICVAECADGWYATPEQECHRCHYMCRTCSGGSNSDCLTCQQPLLLVHVGEETQCTTSCPAGFFQNDESVCSPCSLTCQRCERTPDTCIECIGRLVLYNQTCITNCPDRTYNDGNGRCLPCESVCETCIGPGVRNCLKCLSNLFYFNGTCLKSCPAGYYAKRGSNECHRCNSTCTGGDCLSCWPMMAAGVQKPININRECPEGTYFDQDRCPPCHASCRACVGPSFSQCSMCLGNKFLYKNVCLQQCPVGFYAHFMHTCLPCPEGCSSCLSNGVDQLCISCFYGLTLHNGNCTTGCPSGMFNVGNGGCLKCHPSCRTCNGTESRDCLGCHSGNTLIQNECRTECALNYFHNGARCVPCHLSCRTCKGDGKSDCLSCHERLTLNEGNCIECGLNQFFHPLWENCSSCGETCATCNGPDAFSCLTCVTPLRRDPLLQRCVQCCNGNARSNDCCQCDKQTGLCIVVTSVTNKRRTYNDEAPSETQIALTRTESLSINQLSFVIALIAICAIIVVSFGAIFAFLQGKSKASNRSSIRYKKLQSMNNEGGQRVEEFLENLCGDEEITSATSLITKI